MMPDIPEAPDMPDITVDPTSATAFAISERVDEILKGNPLDAVELAVALIITKLAFVKSGDSHENMGALFERAHGILSRWEQEQAAKALLLNMETKGPMQ